MAESSSINYKPVLITASLVFLTIAATMVGAVVLAPPHEPGLRNAHNATEGRDFRNMKETELYELRTYGWMDKKKGIARVPIERAMDMMLQKNAFPVSRSGEGGGK